MIPPDVPPATGKVSSTPNSYASGTKAFKAIPLKIQTAKTIILLLGRNPVVIPTALDNHKKQTLATPLSRSISPFKFFRNHRSAALAMIKPMLHPAAIDVKPNQPTSFCDQPRGCNIDINIPSQPPYAPSERPTASDNIIKDGDDSACFTAEKKSVPFGGCFIDVNGSEEKFAESFIESPFWITWLVSRVVTSLCSKMDEEGLGGVGGSSGK